MVNPLDLCDYPFQLLDQSNSCIAIDTETSGWGKDVDNAPVIYYSWAADDIPAGAGSPLTEQGCAFLQALCSCARPKIVHNLKADVKFLRDTGFELKGPYHNTLLMHHFLDPYHTGGHALDVLSYELLGRRRVDYYQLEHYAKQFNKAVRNIRILEHNQALLHVYNLQDSIDALELYNLLKPQLEAKELWKVYCEEVDAEVAYIKLMQRGIQIDVRAAGEAEAKLNEPVQRLLEKLWTLFGEEFNPASRIQLPTMLLKAGFELTELTDGGKAAKKSGEAILPKHFATDKDTLRKWVDDDERIQTLFGYQFLNSARSKLRNYQEHTNEKGRGYPNYRLTTATGRSACSKLPLQQVPNQAGRLTETELGDEVLAELCGEAFLYVRAIIIAAPGAILICSDYAQVEYRAAVHYTQSQRLIDALRRGEEFHEITCKIVFDRYEDQLRNLIKCVNYGLMYGMGKELLLKRISRYSSDPESVLARYKRALPELDTFKTKVMEKAKRKGYVQDVFGRKYWLQHGAEYKMINYLCQGTAAGIKKRSLVRLTDIYEGTRSGVIADIHDDLPQEIYPEDISLLPQVVLAMEDYPMFDVPFKVGLSVGLNLKDQVKCKQGVGQAIQRAKELFDVLARSN